jgi:hypothetical protein
MHCSLVHLSVNGSTNGTTTRGRKPVYFARNFWNDEWSITTLPTDRSRFRPSFCLSSSFFRLEMSLACSLAKTSFRNGLRVSRATTLLPVAA